MNTKKTTGRFLLEVLQSHGVRQIYGVPGDYILSFASALEAFDGIEHVTMVDERDAAWAANLAGRGALSACYATSMVGCLNMLNGVCDGTKNLGASALVIIGGEVALSDRGADYILHHELGAPPAPVQEEIFKILLGGEKYAKSITDIASAQTDIAQIVTLAREEHRPVYIGIPKDVCEMILPDVSVPLPVCRIKHENGSFYSHSLAKKMRDSIDKAKHPVLLVGQLAERFNLIPLIKNLAETYGIPVITTHKGFGAYPLNDDYFIGTYAGHASCPPYVQSIIEESDCLITIGAVYCDMTYGLQPPRLPKETISIDPCALRISHGISWLALSSLSELRLFCKNLVGTKRKCGQKLTPTQAFSSWMNDESSRYFSKPLDDSRQIRFADVAPLVHRTLEDYPDTPVVADIGNAMAIPVVAGGYYTSAYGAMGVTVGAIGIEKMSGKRPLVIVGDGAFEMWSLGSLLMLRKYHSKMIIVVLNNEGWGMLRPIAENAPYLNFPSGNFEKLTEVAGCGAGFRVETLAQLKRALDESFSADTLSIINVILSKDDTTDTIRKFMAK